VRAGAAVAAAAAILLLAGAAFFRGPSPGRANLDQADKLMTEGDWDRSFELYHQAVRSHPSDAQALAGREEARRRLIGRALAQLEKAMADLNKAREDAEVKAKRKPQTLDQEQRFADEKKAAEELVRKAEARVHAAREEAQRLLTLGER
jgi:hypothetical protein